MYIVLVQYTNITTYYLPSGSTARAIVASVEAAVRAGRLQPGDPLPAVRRLADERQVSPSTVAAAYRELRRRGVVYGAGRGGTRVRERPPIGLHLQVAPPPGVRSLLSGGPDPGLLPEPPRLRRTWRRAYGEAPVLPRLEVLAAEHLAADGLDPRHLAVVSGALDGVERLLSSWLAVGDRVVVEDPGYTAVLDLVAAMGFVPVPVPLDDAGVRPEPLAEALRRGAEAVVLTPRAQNPTGTAWDVSRAARLASIFRRHPDVLVVEDDHAGPVAGVPSLTACRGLTRWAVVRSVSKWLGPDMRLAMLIGDETTVARVEGRQALGIGWVSYVLQGMVADLLEDPGTRRSLARARTVYERRRGALLQELRTRGLAATGTSGLTTWVPVGDEDGVTARLAGAGWAVSPGQRFRLSAPPGIRVASALLEPAEARAFAGDFAATVHQRPLRFD